jgi:hypothetical protein
MAPAAETERHGPSQNIGVMDINKTSSWERVQQRAKLVEYNRMGEEDGRRGNIYRQQQSDGYRLRYGTLVQSAAQGRGETEGFPCEQTGLEGSQINHA